MSNFQGPYTSLKELLALKLQVKNLSLAKAKKVSRPQSGLHYSKFRGRGMEFAEVRTYQPGDDVRSIDWRVTARRNSPHTKIFNEERERPILILCDQSQSMFFGSQHCFKSVKAAEAAALFSWAALKQNDRVGGIVFSNTGHHEIKPARSRKSVMQLLSCIERFNNSLSIATEMEGSNDAFNNALAELSRTAKPGTLIVLISDFLKLDPLSEKHITKLSRHNELIFLQITDPLEAHLPKPGIYPIAQGDQTLVINSYSKADREKFSRYFDQHVTTLKSLTDRCRSPYIQLSTGDHMPNALINVLNSYSRT